MKGNNCRGKLLFFSFSCKIVENVHLQLSTMLKGGWNKEFDDLQFLHLFCDFSASQMWSEIILQIKKVENSACAFYFSMSTIRINTIFLFRIWDNSSIFSFVIVNDLKIKEFSMFVSMYNFAKSQKLKVINMLTCLYVAVKKRLCVLPIPLKYPLGDYRKETRIQHKLCKKADGTYTRDWSNLTKLQRQK